MSPLAIINDNLLVFSVIFISLLFMMLILLIWVSIKLDALKKELIAKSNDLSAKDTLLTQLTANIEQYKATISKLHDYQLQHVGKINEQVATVNFLQKQKNDLDMQVSKLTTDFYKLQEEKNNLAIQYAQLKIAFDNSQKFDDRLNETLTKVKQELELHSEKITSLNTQSLKLQNAETLTTLLTPLNKEFKEFKEEISKTRSSSIEQSTTLNNHITTLVEAQKLLSAKAEDLTNALSNNKKMQGMWGELILEKVLEASGLRKNQEYFREVSYKDDENNNKRPDAIIKLPNNHELIIDAKCSLNDFVSYCSAKDDSSRSACLKRLRQAVINHIDTLSGRKYPELDKLNSPSLVFMFIPAEGPLAAILQVDSSILTYALNKHIALTTPSTLLSSLAIAKQLWDLENHNKDVKLLISQIQKIYDKLCGFLENFTKVGSSIEKARLAYTNATKQLCTGTGNLVYLGNNLNERINSNKKLPEELLNYASIKTITSKVTEGKDEVFEGDLVANIEDNREDNLKGKTEEDNN